VTAKLLPSRNPASLHTQGVDTVRPELFWRRRGGTTHDCTGPQQRWSRTRAEGRRRAARSSSGGWKCAALPQAFTLALAVRASVPGPWGGALLETYLANAVAHASKLPTNALHVVGQEHGVEEQAVTVRDLERSGQTLDVTVAARALQQGALFALP